MKEMIDTRQENDRAGRHFGAPQRAGNIGARCRHLCVACALRKHDFEERAPEPESDWPDDVPVAKAWIDGLPYRTVYHLASRGIGCSDCGEKVIMTYDPEHVHERPVALCKT